jgi:hypothetical protein
MNQTIYLASDFADLAREAGLTMRTAATVRAGIASGRLNPDLGSPRGVRCWSRTALMRDLEAMWLRQRRRASYGPLGPPPKQLEIGG